MDEESPEQSFWCVRAFRSKVCQNNFSMSGTPKIDDFGPFQESMVEISVKWEKTCFLRPRFFRKIEEMGGCFWGCALKFFSQLCTNVESFKKKIFGIGGKLVDLCGFFSARFFLPITVGPK